MSQTRSFLRLCGPAALFLESSRNKATKDGVSILGTDLSVANVSDTTHNIDPARAHLVPRAKAIIHRNFRADNSRHRGVTAAWMCILGYGLVRLVELLI